MKKLVDKYSKFIKYIFSAGISYVIDISLFTLFNYLFTKIGLAAILIATIIARVISSCINYLLNRNRVFANNKENKFDIKTFTKYAILVVIQMFVSSFAVMYIYESTKINATVIKLFVDAILFVVNYFVQKNFIFIDRVKVERKKSTLELLIFSMLGAFAFVINPIATTGMLKIDVDGHALILAVVAVFMYFYYKKYFNTIKREKLFSFISAIFSLLMIFGYSFMASNSANLVYGDIQYLALSIIKFVGFYTFFNLVISHAYIMICESKIKPLNENKFISYFEAHPFKTSFIFLSCVFFIFLLAYYPGVIGYDPSYQIKEVMGIPNFYTESTTFSINSLITQFNPVLHTLLIGYLFKFGYILGNVNFGLFIYTLIQMIVVIFTLSYTIKFMKEEQVSTRITLAIMFVYALVPIFPYYAVSAFKDTYYATFFILFIIQIYKFIKYDANKKNIIELIIFSLLLCAFRHNGYITVLISLLLLMLANKKNIKALCIAILVISIVHIGYSKTLDYIGIAPTSVREVLSVPIQQTSRLIKDNEDIIELKDREAIDKIIDYDYVKDHYNPELADPIKNTYKKDATKEDLVAYFGIWFKYLLKKPLTYVDATVNNMYGYFYPGKQNWYFYHQKYNVLNEVGFDYHYNNLSVLRAILSSYGYAFAYIPVLGLLVNIGFTTWVYILLALFLIVNKNKKYIILLVPAYLTILMCIVGPVNTYYRYVLPYAASLPLVLALLYNECVLKQSDLKKNKARKRQN